MIYLTVNANGKRVHEQLPDAVANSLSVLPYSPTSYFEVDDSTTSIPLDKLISKRARAKGISNANLLMRQAYDCAGSKRAPIAVVDLADGYYLVEDGNSTLMNARFSQWPDIACKIIAS